MQPGTTVPPPRAASKRAGLGRAARSCSSRSTPRSNRAEASENSRCRLLIRAVPRAEKCAASMTRLRDYSEISVARPPMVPAIEIGPGRVGDQDVVGVQVADHVVEGLQPLARPGPADHDRPVQPVPVERVQRLAQLQHQVVGDVDGQRHRAHAGPGQPDPHPQRGRPGRVDAADLAQHEPVAGGRVLDAGRVHLGGHRIDIGGQAQRRPGR